LAIPPQEEENAGMRIIWIAIWVLVIPAQGADQAYVTAKLSNVDVTDMSATLDIPPMTVPIPLGVMYQFTIEGDDITYLAGCTSKARKGYAAEWVVNDPVQFRIDKYKIFLKRPNGKELRLGLVTKVRGSKPEGTDLSNTTKTASHATARQNIPECR
jgi:hypothetical protein